MLKGEFRDRDWIERDELRKFFTDRQSLIDKFLEKLKQPAPVPVLFYFGVAGCGKTYFLHYLKNEFGSSWNDPSQGNPNAFISFRMGSMSTDSTEALWSIRNQLRNYSKRLVFPRLDLLWGKLWERTYKISIQNHATLVPEEAAWLLELIQITEKVPVLGNLAKAVNLIGRLRGRAKDWLGKRKVLEWFKDHLEKAYESNWKDILRAMEVGELAQLLPKAIAADLADGAAVLKPLQKRIILFFDNYEYLQKQLGELHGKEVSGFVQSLAKELIMLKANVLTVISGQNKSRWAEVKRSSGDWVPDFSSIWARDTCRNEVGCFVSASLEQHLMDELSKKDSMEYLLNRRGLADETMAREIYKLTGGYALALSTTIDLMKEAGQTATQELSNLRARVSDFKFLSKEWRDELNAWLLERLIYQLNRSHPELVELVQAASVPRWFDEELLFHLAGDHFSQENFDHLVGYSFIEQREGATGRKAYKYHSITQRCLRESIRVDAQRRMWNNIAKEYFNDLMNNARNADQRFAFEVEVLYHQTVLDPLTGLDAIEAAFDRELESYNLAHCEALIRALTDREDQFVAEEARMLTLRGRLYLVSAQYELALEKLREADKLQRLKRRFEPHRVGILQNLAECYRLKGELVKALNKWEALRRLGGRYKKPLVLLQAKWGMSLTYKLLDNIPRALRLCEDVENQLGKPGTEISLVDAVGFGMHTITKNPAHVMRHKAELLRYAGDYLAAGACCEKFLSLYEDSPESLGYFYGLLVSGHLHRMEGDFSTAFNLTKDAKEGYDKLSEFRGQLSAARSFGQIAFAQGQDTKALKYFQFLMDCPHGVYPYGPIYGHLGLGELSRISGSFGDADYHYKKADKLCRSLGGKIETAYAMLGRAEIVRQKGKVDKDLIAEIENTGIKCGHPWIRVYANLLGASIASKKNQSVYILKAINASKLFKRRESDRNLEGQIITKVKKLLAADEKIPPFRFNFL